MNRSIVGMLLLAAAMALPACGGAPASPPPEADKNKSATTPTTRPTTQPAKVKITIGKDTTYITGPLNADGTVNYVAYINAKHSKGVTPENNAAVLMLRALGPEIWPEEVRAKAFEKMGITAPPLNGDYFVTVDQYVDSLPKPPPDSTDEPDEQLDRAMQAPWSAKTLPTIAGWLEANDTPLALAVEATKRPRFYQPLISTSNPPQILDTLSGPWTDHMAVAKALTARTMMKIDAGDRDGAWADIMALQRLGRLLGQGPTLIDHLVALAIEAMGSKSTVAYITREKLPAKRLRTCQADLKALGALPDLRQAMTTERFVALDVTMLLARGEGLEDFEGDAPTQLLFKAVTQRLIDWNVMLRSFNYWHDRLLDVMTEPDAQKRRQADEEFMNDLDELGKKLEKRMSGLNLARTALGALTRSVIGLPSKDVTELVSGHLVRILMPALGEIADRYHASLMRLELLNVAITLALHEAETGTFPTTLGELTPKYIKAIPTDRCSGKALVYRREGKGCIVYSVGKNLTDDGGVDNRDDEDADDEVERDDIAVRFKR